MFNTRLETAVSFGKIETVQQELGKLKWPDEANIIEKAYSLARLTNFSDAMTQIIEHSPDFDKDSAKTNTKPLEEAIIAGNLEDLKKAAKEIQIIDEQEQWIWPKSQSYWWRMSRSHKQWSLLHIALAHQAHSDIVAWLIRLLALSSKDNPEKYCTELEEQNSYEESAFYQVCAYKNTVYPDEKIRAYISILLKRHADPLFKRPSNGWSCFYIACRNGNQTAVESLLHYFKQKYDEAEYHAIVNFQNKNQTSCVNTAAYGGHGAIVKLLHSEGADIKVADRAGATPLHGAANKICNNEIVQYLINAGANVNALTIENKESPLLHAVFHGSADVAQTLIKAGAKITERILKCAEQRGDADILACLNAAMNTQEEIISRPASAALHRSRIELTPSSLGRQAPDFCQLVRFQHVL